MGLVLPVALTVLPETSPLPATTRVTGQGRGVLKADHRSLVREFLDPDRLVVDAKWTAHVDVLCAFLVLCRNAQMSVEFSTRGPGRGGGEGTRDLRSVPEWLGGVSQDFLVTHVVEGLPRH